MTNAKETALQQLSSISQRQLLEAQADMQGLSGNA